MVHRSNSQVLTDAELLAVLFHLLNVFAPEDTRFAAAWGLLATVR